MQIVMEYLGIDLSCAVWSLRHGNFLDKVCLLPLFSKLLEFHKFQLSLMLSFSLCKYIKIYKMDIIDVSKNKYSDSSLIDKTGLKIQLIFPQLLPESKLPNIAITHYTKT